MESPLITHIFIESFFNHKGLLTEEHFLYGKDRTQLLESYGIFNGCEDAANEIVTAVEHCDDDVKEFVISPESIRFFAKRVNIILLSGGIMGGAYHDNESEIDDNGIFKEITISLNRDRTRKQILTSLVHELTHAYQDFCMYKKNSSIGQHAEDVGYNDTASILANGNIKGIMKYMSTLMYLFNTFEMGAHMSSLLIDVIDALENNKFENITSAVNYIKKNCRIVDQYNYINRLVNAYTKKDLSDEEKELTLYAANRVSNYNFKTYKQLVNWLKKHRDKIAKKIETILPKIVNEKMQVSESMLPSNIADMIIENLKREIDFFDLKF